MELAENRGRLEPVSTESAPNRSSAGGGGARWALVCLLLLTAPRALAAASPPGAEPETVLGRGSALTRHAWTTDEGLPDNSVLSIAQTRDGYLWIGTRGGLARFDGVRFVVFDQRTQPSWSSDTINALCASGDGGLWVGMVDGGLLHLRNGVFSQVPLPSLTVRALHEARDGTLWVAMDRGLARLRPGGTAEVAEMFAATYVYAFCEDPDGSVWLGTSNGLYVYRQGQFGAAAQHMGLSSHAVYAIRRGANQVLYVGADGGGLYRIPGSPAEAVRGEEGPIWSVLEDRRGRVWIASDHGLKHLDGDRLDTAFGEQGLSGRVLTLFEDREGSLWVGTRYSGVVRLTAGRATSIGHQLEHPSVLTVLEDRKGHLWFGTAGGGLGRLDGDRLKSYRRRNGLVSDIIGPIIEDREGRIWFGPREGDRLQRIENGRVSSFPIQGTPASLHEDLDGALWVGTTGDGLYRVRKGQLTRWTTQDGLPSRAVRAMVDDGQGGLWLGTPRGLVHFRERPLVVYTTANGLRSDRVMALYQEPGGPLWVGTSRGGLARFEDGRFTSYGPEQGLCDNQVLAILDDGLGNLWMSSSRGIFQVAKQQLDEVAAGVRARVSCLAYGRGDGMESAQCNGGYQPSGWRARDGRLWFPTVKGLVVVDPTRLHPSNLVPPPVWIESVQADGRAVPLTGTGRLPAGTKRLEIDYTALSLVAPDKVRFRHRLSGFDRQWVEAGRRRRISYTNLPPGDYRFEVIACNNDGLWNEQGHRWDFRIAPFFYQTAWFYGAMALLVVGAGSGLHALRVRQLRLRNAVLAERAHLSQEIHDHISQIMTGVVLQLDAASQTVAQGLSASAPYIDRASRLARQGIEETRLILRSLREGPTLPASVDWGVDEALVERVAPLIEGTGVQLKARRKGQPFPLSPDAKSEMFRVGQEAVTNALRHGQARQIDIVVAFERQGVRLTIEDDGRGFEPSAVGEETDPGLGLTGMADRIARRHGTFDVRSRPGGGTTVAAFFPKEARVE